jgi:hypothetical protein
LDAQGYGVCENKVFQDNQSAILLEKNGRHSSSRQTQHINIRYFFVTDQIQSKELTVEYCRTGEMLADMFTKPLQGSTFRCFRAAVMNNKTDCPAAPGGAPVHRSVLENNDKRRTDGSNAVQLKVDVAGKVRVDSK